MLTNETGFSLLEVVLAAAIAIIISSAGYILLPNLISNSESRTEAYEQCNLQRETEIMSLLDGQQVEVAPTCAPTPTPTP